MDIKLVNRGQEGELRLSGRLDAHTSDQATELFLQTAERFRDITLELSGLKYISSSGLRSLSILYMKVKENGGELLVKNAAPNIVEVLEMTGFAEMFYRK